MIQAKGRYCDGRIELDQPIDLANGTVVEVAIHATADATDEEGWKRLAIERLEQEWDNDRDAIYDDWRRLYGVQAP